MRPLAEAQADVLDSVPSLPVVSVPPGDAAGLALAEVVRALHDVPPFSNSAMDGFAVRGDDIAVAPVELVVLEDVPAGSVPNRPVTAGTAIKIMTGAPLPAGADTVVKVEDVEELGTGRVRVLAATAPGTSVRRAGGDMAAGALVFERGVRLGPAHLGVLASLGVMPEVRRRPVVAVLSTGDEVVPPDTQTLEPGKIRDSNRPQLVGLLTELGVVIRDLGIVPDDERLLRATLERAARETDVVVTSGGVSMGEYDLVKQVLMQLGSVEFWRVAMQPAKPFAFGSIAGTPLFGLPGNPVSVFVAFEQFLRPALLTMMGSAKVFRPRIRGTMDENVATDPDKTVFVRVATEYEPDSGWAARRSGGQSSNVLSALAGADALAVVPVGVGDVARGDDVVLEMFRWPEQRTREEVLGE
jgi:molybdenum cofactor synthesis domain-containing protein